MTGRLDGKVALITGAGGGLGTAVAELFAREGAQLVLTDHDFRLLAEVTRRAEAHGADVLDITHDVTSPEQWAAVVEAVEARFGALHVLAPIAGIVAWSGVEATTDAEWDRVIAVNQTGTWLGMRAALPLLRASRPASVITTSSVLGIIGGGGASAYHASKGAVRLLTKTAAVEYATEGVRFNSVHPGVVATPMIQDILDREGNEQADIARTPMRRAARPEEIAPAYLYLAGDESSFVTGTELVVDGGLTAH